MMKVPLNVGQVHLKVILKLARVKIAMIFLPGMQRQFYVLELQKTAAIDNMSNALKNAAISSSCNTSVFGCGLAYLAGKIEEH